MSKNNYLYLLLSTMEEERGDECMESIIELKQHMHEQRMSADVVIGLAAHLMDTFSDPQYLEDNPNAVPPAEAFAYICKEFAESTMGKALTDDIGECNE